MTADPVLVAVSFALGVATGMTLILYLLSRADRKAAERGFARWRGRQG